MIEHNNRLKAKKLAEYITGQELRQYCAKKVHEYCGEKLESIFDGAIGSGQLEQYINVDVIHGVEIQQESCDAAMLNYPHSKIECKSFFEYESEKLHDAVLMNPPFSLPFKDLTESERKAIVKNYPWKKSGVVDDIFLLKGLENTKRFGFYIMFGGIAYRKTELQMRSLIGNALTELNVVKNAFDDTPIDVLFLIIDKNKQTPTVLRNTYDCKSKKNKEHEPLQLNSDWSWEVGRDTTVREVVNIEQLERDIKRMKMARRNAEDKLDAFIEATFKTKVEQNSLF